ncbi:hypothetical protein QO002_005603 [Pararhizobium capsulatum DSM 1112]|uniref:Uncharacterized protein n=1 Tax=Pararhizobium capsulatum DSM 1112 TaxID=1121113 RepID=A0ABU0BYM5_9HYPH|nr:hypothetical protein [Pararhizobium capsulatum]MDQ0323368.1 hypothetical protein [Pararhizobium capsulatum DSM 1112]MDQ0323397.1 hypothetical protein [Pararhizobium capsulatum DSM 1112]
MTSRNPENRYKMCKNEGDEFWTVYDIFTGEPAEMSGTWLTACEMDEANDLVDLLNLEYINRRKGRHIE